MKRAKFKVLFSSTVTQKPQTFSIQPLKIPIQLFSIFRVKMGSKEGSF